MTMFAFWKKFATPSELRAAGVLGMNRRNYEIIAKSNMDVAKTKLSYNTYRRYLNLLGDLGINPITIPDDCGLQYIKSPFTFPSPTVSTIPSAST